jgi:glycerophosphoryl diester phosphodiesterase
MFFAKKEERIGDYAQRNMKKSLKSSVCLLLVALLVFSVVSGALPELNSVHAVNSSENVYCNVRFSKPAICCDVGDLVLLANCGVQFAADAEMTAGSITWTYNGDDITSFRPTERGVYALTAKAGDKTKTVYVVAKNPEETEYVLYRNDFDSAPTDFRVAEQTNGATVTVSDSNYIIDAAADANAYVRVLLPDFLDAFGDAKMKASMKIVSAYDAKKWVSLMYRVQNGDYPYYQGLMRQDASLYNGIEISQRNSQNVWEVYENTSFSYTNESGYNLCAVTAKGTSSVFHINGREILRYSNTAFANGAFGIQTRGTKLMVDYVEITLDGNDAIYESWDVSFAKPAIRADMGNTIDLTNCDVQFSANAVYTKGSDITWRKDGTVITSFTPTNAGVTRLTASSGNITKTIYVVTRNLDDGEYVLYRNDFDTAPTDFRVIQKTNSTAYHDGAGHYILDASASAASYSRVLLPAFLDDFGDFKFEASYLESNAVDEKKWSALMAHVQNEDFPYIQFCVRSNAALANGVEMSEKSQSAQTAWNVWAEAATTEKVANSFNTYALIAQNNQLTGRINGEDVISFDEHPYVVGAMGFQTRGVKLTIDYVKVTLGENTAQEDSAVKCAVSKARPAIGCNAGQTILLDQCEVQFTYGAYPVDGSQITWTKDGEVITEFSDTSLGTHVLTATHGHTSMDIYVIAKKTTAREHVLYSNDFTNGPTDYRIPESTNGGRVYPIDGTFVLNGSASADSYIRVLLPAWLDQFGDADFEASIKLSAPADSTKWGAVMYRVQNATIPYLQCCWRYDSTASNGVEISQRTPDNTWNVLHNASTTVHSAGGHNLIRVKTKSVQTVFSINGTDVLTATSTPYYNGSWGFHVRGLTMTVDYVRMSFTSNYSSRELYTIPGGYVDVRDPSTGISVAPSLITDIKSREEFDNILTDCPAVAIMNYDVVDGVAKILFNDGAITPDEALNKLGSKIIPAFRIGDNADADSLAAFLQGRGLRDAYAVSDNLSVLKRAYSKWKYIRGVADYSSFTSFDAEAMRYAALANGARVMILPESAPKAVITQMQDSYACVWLTISEGKTASVAATNKGPYGLITPDRAVTEYCYRTYYGDNTLIRRTNVIGHRGNPSVAPENTILGTVTAYGNGATMVENDIYLTADNVVVVMHDKTIDRTTNGSGSIQNMTSAQLGQYKVDYFSGVSPQAIPTLEDYFKTIKGNARQKVVIEMKHPADASLADAMTALIQKYDIMDQVVVISFIQQNLVNTSNNLPGLPIGWLNRLDLDETNPVYSTYEVLENIQDYNSVYNPEYKGWGEAIIKELAYRGVTLWPWTVNNQAQFDKLMMEGIAGITTDYSQWSKDYIDSIHWNSAGRVISSTYQSILTDITNSCEVVIVEDTLGITCSAGNITVPETTTGGKASFYYRYKRQTPTGQTYYTVTEIRTIEVASPVSFELIDGSSLSLSDAYLTNVTNSHTVAALKAEFKHPVYVVDSDGVMLDDEAVVTTGSTVFLEGNTSQNAVVIIKGDVNGDGAVDTTDCLQIKSHFLNRTQLQSVYLIAADCDGDGAITSTDYLRIKAHFLGTFDLYS